MELDKMSADPTTDELVRESLKSARWLLTGNTTQDELRAQIIRMADLIERLRDRVVEQAGRIAELKHKLSQRRGDEYDD